MWEGQTDRRASTGWEHGLQSRAFMYSANYIPVSSQSWQLSGSWGPQRGPTPNFIYIWNSGKARWIAKMLGFNNSMKGNEIWSPKTRAKCEISEKNIKGFSGVNDQSLSPLCGFYLRKQCLYLEDKQEKQLPNKAHSTFMLLQFACSEDSSRSLKETWQLTISFLIGMDLICLGGPFASTTQSVLRAKAQGGVLERESTASGCCRDNYQRWTPG